MNLPLLLSALAYGAARAAYTPTRAEWSTTIHPHKYQPPAAAAAAAQPRDADAAISTTNISSTAQLSYAVDVTIGSTPTKLLLDSGSFTVWTAAPDYVCTDVTTNYTHEHCGITGVWRPAADPAGAVQEREGVYASNYGSGYAGGQVWNTSVTLAGLEVQDFTIGYADQVNFDAGDGIISGIVGLGLGISTGFYWNDVKRPAFQPTGLFSRLREKLDRWEFAM